MAPGSRRTSRPARTTPAPAAGEPKRFAVVLRPGYLEALDDAAKARGLSRAKLIERLLERAGLIADVPRGTTPAPQRPTGDVAPNFKRGLP